MTIKDKQVDAYVLQNMEDIPPAKQQSAFMQEILKEKSEARKAIIVQIVQL